MRKTYIGVVVTATTIISLLGGSVALAASTTASSVNTPAPFMSISALRTGNVKLEGTLVSASGSTLTVASWGGNWSVDASSAKLLRRFGGSSTPSEFQAGDQLIVWGSMQTGAWSIAAKQIQDYSIQVRNVSPYGTVSNVSATGFTLTTSNSKVYQVTLGSNVVVVINGKKSTESSIVNGSKAQVSGVLDRNLSTITATRVRDTTPKVRVNSDSSVNDSASTNDGNGNGIGASVNANLNTNVNVSH